MKRRTFVSAGLGLAAAAPRAARAAFGDTPFTAQVNFGLVVPLSGPNLREGEQIANGVRQAISDANQYRGALDKLYGFRTFDDQNLLASGILQAQFACDDQNTTGVIGHLSGKITDQALPAYFNNRMPIVVPASTYDNLTAHHYRNVFRLPTKDSTEGRLACKYFQAGGAKKPAVLIQDGDYGGLVAAGFEQQAVADKIDEHTVQFTYEKPDYAAAARKTLESAPDLVYLAGTALDMGPAIKALRDAGYRGTLAASQGFFDPLTIAKYGALAEGLIVSTSMPPLYLAPSAFRIKNDFEARYGPFTPLSAFGYAAAQVLMAAVKRSGGYDRATVARTIGTSGPIDTVVGQFQFTYDGDPLDPNLYFYTVRDGKWAYLKAAHPTTFILK